MSGADDRPRALPPELLRTLREADEWLARRPPARALEQRIFAADPAPRGAGLLRFAQIAVPVVLLILYAFERSRPEPTRASPSEAARVLRLDRDEAGVIDRFPEAREPEPAPIVTPTDAEYEDIDEPEPTPVLPTIEAPLPPAMSVIETPAPAEPEAATTLTPRRGVPGVVLTPATDEAASPIATPQGAPPTPGGATARPPASGGSETTTAHARPTPRPAPTPNHEAPRDENPEEVEVHVIAVYDSYDAARDQDGEASLHITRPGRHIVVVSAYAGTRWTVTVDDGVEGLHVLALGFEQQSIVSAPASATLEVMEAGRDGGFAACSFEYPDTELDGCETDDLLNYIESLFTLPITSFHGCYAASSFVLADDLGVASDCWTEAGYKLTGFP